MTPLRQRMIREMQLQRFADNTIETYVMAVAALALEVPDQKQSP